MNKQLISLILGIVMLSIVLFMLIFLMHEEYIHEIKRIKTKDLTKEFNKKIEPFKEVIEVEARPILYQYFDRNGYNERYENPKGKITLGELTKYKVKKSKYTWLKVIKNIFSAIFTLIILFLFAIGLHFKVTNTTPVINDIKYVTVLTGSMSEKHEDNTYLDSLNLNNQIEQFALIGLEKVNDPKDIKLFDVYAYLDNHGELIIHRIVKEEVINDKTYYTFRGDANSVSDYYLVEAKDVLYKYNGAKNIPLGYIFSFINSIIGQITILYTLTAILILDIYDLKKKKAYNLAFNNYIDSLNKIELDKFNEARK